MARVLNKRKDALGEKVCFIHQKMERKDNWNRTWDEVARYVQPNKDYVYERKYGGGSIQQGEERHHKLYDNTAEHSNTLLASAMQSLVTNPTQQFYGLSSGDIRVDRRPRVRLWLQELVRYQHQILRNSNFDPEVHSNYKDLGSFGTAILRMEEDDEDILRFTAENIFDYTLMEDKTGRVAALSTEKEWRVSDAIDEYGKDAFQGTLDTKRPHDTVIIVHMTISKNLGKLHDLSGNSTEKFDFLSLHVLKKEKLVLKEKGFYEFPFAVPRWDKIPGEVYGRGPGIKALPEVRMVNKLRQIHLRAMQKVVDPPLTVIDDGIFGRVNLRPGGLTSIRDYGRNANPVQPIITGGRVDISADQIEAARNEIRKMFFIDQLQLREGDRMTTVEVNVRDDDRTRLLAPLVGRLNQELLAPVVNRLTSSMQRRDLLPPNMPEELRGMPLQVFFNSQIAKAQKQIEANNHSRWLGVMAPIAEANPEALSLLDIEKYARKMAELHGVDENVLKKPEEIEQERQAQQQAQQQQQDIDNTQQLSQAVKNTADVIPLNRGL